MTHRFEIIKDYYDIGEQIYRKTSVTLRDGLTVLCGCNGSGKTTLIRQIENSLRKDDVPFIEFNNLIDGGANAVNERAFVGDMDFVFQSITSSEGENICKNITRYASKIGEFIAKHSDQKEIFVFMDAIDSGLSIDNVIDIKQDMFELVIDDCRKNGIAVYIVVSANEYEMANGEQCMDVLNLKYVSVKTYERFKKIVIESREAKDIRYNRENRKS